MGRKNTQEYLYISPTRNGRREKARVGRQKFEEKKKTHADTTMSLEGPHPSQLKGFRISEASSAMRHKFSQARGNKQLWE